MAKKLELIGALHSAVTDKNCPVSVATICEALDKAPSTLYNELNPYPGPDSRHKLGLEDAAVIMALLGDSTCLDLLAARLGFTLRHMTEACPDKRTLPEELLDDLPALAHYHEAMRAGLPVPLVAELLRQAIQELEEDFAKYCAQQESPIVIDRKAS